MCTQKKASLLIIRDKLADVQVKTNCWYSEAQMCTQKKASLLIICEKLAYVQVITNCQYSVAQMCTREESLPANYLWQLSVCTGHN